MRSRERRVVLLGMRCESDVPSGLMRGGPGDLHDGLHGRETQENEETNESKEEEGDSGDLGDEADGVGGVDGVGGGGDEYCHSWADAVVMVVVIVCRARTRGTST